jgi:hypothetical protein
VNGVKQNGSEGMSLQPSHAYLLVADGRGGIVEIRI